MKTIVFTGGGTAGQCFSQYRTYGRIITREMVHSLHWHERWS